MYRLGRIIKRETKTEGRTTSRRRTPVHSLLLMAPRPQLSPLTGLTAIISERRLPAHWIVAATVYACGGEGHGHSAHVGQYRLVHK
jgi:hypothetical protein